MKLANLVSLASILVPLSAAGASKARNVCVVDPTPSNATDVAPAIIKAFEECGRHGRVVFKPANYYVNSVMDVQGLEDVEIDIQGTLVWSTDIQYWLNNSLDVGYQNQSTAFILGGNNVVIDGHGEGSFYGNGDVWYEFISEQANTSNYPGRPHALTLNGLTNSVVRGLKFLKSQMWTISMIYCHHVDLDNIYVNNFGAVVNSSNTDGVDTIRSSHINFSNWVIYNNDDGISLKGNSTDISIKNCELYGGSGIALGSIGQFAGQFETMQRLTLENLRCYGTVHAVYFKTWTGDQVDYPPNGGGGGLGFASDMTFTNIYTNDLGAAAVALSQCTSFAATSVPPNCTDSLFEIRDIAFHGIRGTLNSPDAGSFQCSALAPCKNIGMFDVNLKQMNGSAANQYLCGNLENPEGFKCTGPACVGSSASGQC